jgi:hypothetical protein
MFGVKRSDCACAPRRNFVRDSGFVFGGRVWKTQDETERFPVGQAGL